MNKKISGVRLVTVPIRQMGINALPFVDDLKERCIKYIDFYPTQYLPGTDAAGVTSSANLFLTLYDEFGTTMLMNALPLERMNYAQTMGNRQPVMSKVSLQSSYIYCNNASMVGKTAALVFYYDLPNFSSRNTTTSVTVDNISVPLTTGSFYNQLPDSDRMVAKRFRRILVSAPSVTPDYQTGIAESCLDNLYLTLCKGTYNVVDNMPVKLLRQIDMVEKTEFANIIFDLQASYITIGGAGTIPTLATDYIGKSVFFNLEYEK